MNLALELVVLAVLSRGVWSLTQGCIENLHHTYSQIRTTVDKNDGWKQAIELGKRTNQNVVFVPHARFIAMLAYKAELVGIQVQITEESYTSQASFLDGDPLPVYDPAHPTPVFRGRRLKRGLYRAADGRRLNADVNGAYNILRKVVPDAFGNGIAGVVVHPIRMTLANGPHGSTVHVA